MFNYRILLIEDNPGDAELTKFYLQDIQNYSITISHCETVADATRLLQNNIFDVVLSDLDLPDSRGLKTVVQVELAASGIPLIVLTGLDDNLVGLEAIKAGAQDYLNKEELNSRLLYKTIQYAIERNKSKVLIESLAIKDDLTGLYNRAGLKLLSGKLVELAKRHGKKMGAVFIDLDYFKNINDLYGHDEGDEALIGTATILMKTFRNSDVIARFGGDEFVAFFLCEDQCNSEIIRSRVLENLKAFNNTSQKAWKVEMSLGIVTFEPTDDIDWDDIIKDVDQLMYNEKNDKRR